MISIIVISVLVILVLIILASSIKIVNTGHVYILERFGQFNKILEPGWHMVIPFVDFVRNKISTKQQILDIQPQTVITKDNVNIQIDNVIFYKVLNAKDAVYNIEDYKSGIVYSTITNMRNIVGNMSLDEVLSGRDTINLELLKIQDDMEKQMKAERDKRALVLQAEGMKQSEIAKAEGEKQSKILRAEAEKEANIRRAEGLRESQLLEAEGKAKAIEIVNQAIIKSGTKKQRLRL